MKNNLIILSCTVGLSIVLILGCWIFSSMSGVRTLFDRKPVN